jgi:cation:H+ antiporter
MEYGFLFIAAGAVVVVAGTALARFGEAIAQRTRAGRLWIGAVLLAGATSLPELGTDVAAVRMGALDLALGDLFGSSMANMLILALIDLLPPRREVLRRATLDHALAACLAMSLSALTAAFLLMRSGYLVAGVSPESIIIFAAYLLGTRAVYRHAMRDFGPIRIPDPVQAEVPIEEQVPTLRRAVLGFAVAALVTLAAAPVFAYSAKAVAEITGLGTTFVGTWLVGLSTSLPELVASIAAVRMGAFDLAVGNLLGSNAFNMAILIAVDLAHPGASIFVDANPTHALTVVFGVILMAMGLAAIVYRAKKRFAMLEPDSALIVLTYVLAIWILYSRRGIG